ncbi:MAG: alpha/beta hydrolase [Alphaproteobacteria bacterium]|nr:alpha/beta hydrolase [Alphaproteobacteria bacterium]
MSSTTRKTETVFLDYTQDELDRAYDQSAWVPHWKSIEDETGPASARVRARMPPRVEAYGPTVAETLDIFAPQSARGLPVMVFVHGGAWTRMTKNDASYPAPTFVANGAIYVALDFACIPAVRIPDMVDQCRRGPLWVVRNAAAFGGDPDRIYLSGHSAGTHMAGCLLTTDWNTHGLDRYPVKGALLLSGMFDLHAVLLSSRRSYVHVSAEEIAALSPMRHLHRLLCPVGVVTADMDSPEFKRQSRVLADALEGMGWLAFRTELFNTNHFEQPEQLADPDSIVGRVALGLMGLRD